MIFKRISLVAFFVFYSALCHAGEIDSQVVAEVNGARIFEKELQASLARKIPWSSFHKNVSDDKRKEFRAEAMEQLIDEELTYQEALRKVTLEASELSVEIDRIKKSYKTEEDYAEALKKAGLSESGLSAKIGRQLRTGKMLKQAVIQPSQISAEEAKEHYDRNREKYFEPEKVKLREIFVEVPANATAAEREEKKKKAAMILEKLKAGGDFGLLAWEYSDDKYKYKSGEIGYIHSGMLSPEIEQEIVGLKPKEMTGSIDTIYGYYIFYLEERMPARQLEFDAVKDKLIKDLGGRKEKKARETFIQELRQKAEIRRF